MFKAALEDSEDLKEQLQQWGLADDFEAAQIVTKPGEFKKGTFNAIVQKGMYVVTLKNGGLVMGGSADETAQQAFKSGIVATIH